MFSSSNIVPVRFKDQKFRSQIIFSTSLLLFRNCENIDLKFNKISSDIEFLQVCAENNLTPKFLNFKPYQHDIRTTKHYSNLQKSLLEKELEIIKKNLKHLKKQSERLLRSLKETVSHIDFDHLVNYLTGGNDTKLKKIKSTQNKNCSTLVCNMKLLD